MSQLGVGVMINMLSSEDSGEAFRASVGKTIASVALEDDALRFVFADGSRMHMSDEGQSCCEHRYMSTDDNLADFAGAKLLGAEIKQAEGKDGEYGDVHEIQFLEIKTDKGSFTMSSHNEHNGYYGGFYIASRSG